MDKKINFAWPVTTLCKFDYYALKNLIESNKKWFADKKIVIMGAGIRGTSFSVLLEKFGYKAEAFTDNNREKIGGYINEYPIWSFEKVKAMREEIIVLISVENGSMLKKQLEVNDFIENRNFFYVENHLYEMYLEEFLRKGEISTLIMGDCGITDISKKDENFTNLGEMLKNDLGKDETKVLAVHAMGMRAFYHVLSAHIEHVSKPQKVVVMVNFETFTGKQHLLPRSQHTKLIEMISTSIGNKDKELVEYAEVTKERFENFKLDYFTSSQEAMSTMSSDRNDRIVIRMNYMYELQEGNENIVYMKRIMEKCKEQGIALLFFIPPVNYMYARELYGDRFIEKYEKNILKIKKITENQNCSLLDLSYLLKSENFADVHTIDETANYVGRNLVKEELVQKINSMG